jgi:predicted pyridoxine 5'-phosphate oxidase superfamily flavin-nucleotide-binding protein
MAYESAGPGIPRVRRRIEAGERAERAEAMADPTSDVAFTLAVKAVQRSRGSREAYARLEARGGFASRVTPELAAFLAERDSVFLGTASRDGRPYVQHRGGPPGFLRCLDERTLAFADFRGNRQYITTGNLSENDRAFLFAMDYRERRRVKIWGRARVVTDDPALLARVRPDGTDAQAEQVIVVEVEAWDTNCRQHIPQLLPAGEVARLVGGLRARIAELEAELARRSAPGAAGAP